MKIRRRARPEAAIELTPLIDVVFLLLIFFMVTTTFIRETELQVDLPEASGQPHERDSTAIEVVISADGRYAVNDRALANTQAGTLTRALRDAAHGDLSKRLIITADGNASHQSVVRVMDAAGQLGLSRLSITTQEPDNDD